MGEADVKNILYLQKPEVMDQHRNEVAAFLEDELPDVTILFASQPDEVPQSALVDVVIAPTLPWLPDALDRLAGYQWIHFLSAGVEKIWTMNFEKQGVLLTKSSGVHGPPMSEFAIGALLYFAKSFGRFHDQSKEHRWERIWLDELTGQQLTILGAGHIGQSLASRAKAFGMSVVGVVNQPRSLQSVDRVISLDELSVELLRTDVLVVCLPLTPHTKGLVDKALISQLKDGAILIDISRGGVVKATDVIDALDHGSLKAAALDVFETQPLPEDSPLWGRDDVLLTPHVSGTTPHYLRRALEVFLSNVKALKRGEGAVTSVDLARGY